MAKIRERRSPRSAIEFGHYKELCELTVKPAETGPPFKLEHELCTANSRRLVLEGPSYFREAAEVIGAAGGGPPDRAKMIEAFLRHGMTVAVPPA